MTRIIEEKQKLYLVQSAPSSHHTCISHFFHLNPMPSSSTWMDAYVADKDATIIMQHLLYHQPFERVTISSLPAQYRSAIANNILGIVEGRLVFYETVPTTSNKIYRIVVPVSLRHTIFSLLHASPTTGHMREYKILYRIKIRFFWPK